MLSALSRSIWVRRGGIWPPTLAGGTYPSCLTTYGQCVASQNSQDCRWRSLLHPLPPRPDDQSLRCQLTPPTHDAMAVEPPTKKKCLGIDCPNDAQVVAVPTCLKLGINDSFFCSQDCFKKNWVSVLTCARPYPWQHTVQSLTTSLLAQAAHKTLHKQENSILHHPIHPRSCLSEIQKRDIYNPFPAFPFTGPLRPVYPLSEKRVGTQVDTAPGLCRRRHPQGEPRACAETRSTCSTPRRRRRCARCAGWRGRSSTSPRRPFRPGITTDEIDEIVHKACIERNVSPPAELPPVFLSAGTDAPA